MSKHRLSRRPVWVAPSGVLARLGVDWSWALGIALVASLTYVIVPHSALSELVFYDGVVLVAFLGACAGCRRRRGPEAAAARWVAVALGLFLLGELTWWGYAAAGSDPFPSFADVSFLSGYVPLALAARSFAAGRERDRDRSAWLDAGVLTLVAGLIVWQVLLDPYLHDPTLSGVGKAVSVAYPMADLLVLGFALRFLLVRSAQSGAGFLFGAGIVATLAADFVFGWGSVRGTFAPGSWVELLWLVGYLALAAASLVSAREDDVPPDDAGLGSGRLVTVLAAVLVPQCVQLVALAREGGVGLSTPTIALGVSTATIVLVALRMWGLLGRARHIERRRATDRLSAVIHHSADTVVLLDADFRVSYASPAVEALLGIEAPACLGALPWSWFVEDDQEGIRRQLENLTPMATGTLLPVEGRVRRGGDAPRTVEGTGCNLLGDDNVRAYVLTLRDVTARRELEEQLERRAFHDELTGLANRALFSDRVAHALSRGSRDPSTGVAVLFIDVDDFKAVNDGLGHAAGDALLEQVAVRLRACLRPADSVARFGGDEFAILLEDVSSSEQAAATAARVLEVLRLPITVGEVELGVPVSIGVAFALADSTVDSLLRDADIAMYSAKAGGKGRVAIFDEGLRAAARGRLALKVDLASALRDQQFRLVFQPIHDITDRRVRGVEALLRWDHPTRGEVSPLEFIPVAEETGDIVAIGHWVLDEACRQAAAWNAGRDVPLTMSVNVSAVQFHHPGFMGDLRAVLAATGLAPHLLVVELTESVLVEHESVVAILSDLRDMGIGIAIDDFGTGYSSLSYLQRFPVTSVKIDRSFVAGLDSSQDNGLVRSILAIAEALSLTTVAEGIETSDQLRTLEDLNCDFAQGFYLGRPISAVGLEELVRSEAGGRTPQPQT